MTRALSRLGVFLALSTVGFAGFVACSSSDPATGVKTNGTDSGTTDGGTLADGSAGDAGSPGNAAHAQALCAYYGRCPSFDGHIIAQDWGTVDACVADMETSYAAAMALPDTGITDAALTACAAALTSLDCNTPLEDVPACAFNGTRGAGFGCSASEQCAKGTTCNFAPGTDPATYETTACPVCVTFSGPGDDCSPDGAPCGPGLYCGEGAPLLGPTCVSTYPQGHSCGSNADDSTCASGLRCIGTTCQKPFAQGAACTVDAKTGDPCGADTACVNGTCAKVAFTATDGQSCASNAVGCLGGYCNVMSGTFEEDGGTLPPPSPVCHGYTASDGERGSGSGYPSYAQTNNQCPH